MNFFEVMDAASYVTEYYIHSSRAKGCQKSLVSFTGYDTQVKRENVGENGVVTP